MEDKNLAQGLIGFINGLPDFWKDLREVVETKLAVIAKAAQTLSKDIFKSKDIFINTIIDMIFLLKKTPKIFQPVFRYILKGIIIMLLDKLDKNWLVNVKRRLGLIKIVNAKVTILDKA